MKIIGVNESVGVYEGSPYDNAVFHGTEAYEQGKGTGLKSHKVKVKQKILTELYGKRLPEKELAAFIGKEVEFFYDEYKNVAFLQVIENNGKS